jgi:ATP-dependent Clp protease ATP-binding subunit ClpC
MSSTTLNLHSVRAKKARLAVSMKSFGVTAWGVGAAVLFTVALYLFFTGSQLGYFAVAAGLFAIMWVVWYKAELAKLPSKLPAKSIDDVLDPHFMAKLKNPVTPRSAWDGLTGHWQEIFVTNRLLVDPSFVREHLSDREVDMEAVWQLAQKLQSAHDSNNLQAGTVATALILSNKELVDFMTKQNLKPEDTLEVYDWLSRLVKYVDAPKPYFGGIGRDWAFGFTPNLERYSVNLSQSVGGHFHFMSRSDTIDAIIKSMSQGTGGIAIVGNTGIGKTSVVSALAERLLQDRNVGTLKDHQIVSLNASAILSAAKQDLERVMLTLFSEAVQSGNMIVFLDEAQLFFQEGVGSFDLSKILLPVIQNRRLKIITAFNTTDYQRLKMTNASLANAFTPIVMAEPPKQDTMKIVEDSALTIERRTQTIITYEAVREAFRLSGQYIQDQAYPGKAIMLLEQATSYTDNNTVTTRSLQQAIEKTLGVKVGGVQTQEADTLLHLEDKIHERMVNQSRAVTVVANALRRARAGVSNSKRPFGSFLFLGPTGVGKTELAKSLAATYFGDEKNMIRLDMSEYQQATDVGRILATGAESDSLLLNIRKQPFSVVLLDEIEKAHSGVLNLLLQLLDEGQLTDVNGNAASFRNSIIIVTSNAGANDIIARINQKLPLEEFERPLIDKLISAGVFRPELVNRFDEVVLFRPLTQAELGQVAKLMLGEVNRNLAHQSISVELTQAALDDLVRQGYDPQFGSRPMRRVIQRTVEDAVAKKILEGQATPGSKISLDLADLQKEEASDKPSEPAQPSPPAAPQQPTTPTQSQPPAPSQPLGQ